MIQKPMFSPQVEWLPPTEFPDLSKYDEIAIDLETKEHDLKTMGYVSVTGRAKIQDVLNNELDLAKKEIELISVDSQLISATYTIRSITSGLIPKITK